MFPIYRRAMQKAISHKIAECFVLFIWNGLENGRGTRLLRSSYNFMWYLANNHVKSGDTMNHENRCLRITINSCEPKREKHAPNHTPLPLPKPVPHLVFSNRQWKIRPQHLPPPDLLPTIPPPDPRHEDGSPPECFWSIRPHPPLLHLSWRAAWRFSCQHGAITARSRNT